MKRLKSLIILGGVCFFASCGGKGGVTIPTPLPIKNLGQAEVILTTPDKANLLMPQPALNYSSSSQNTAIIEIDENKVFQDFIGAGAAITDASGFLIQGLAPEKRMAVLDELFSPNAMNLSFTRLTIGASDFSQSHYSFNDIKQGERDDEIANFSLEKIETTVLPTIKTALSLNPKLKIMASPWSAPHWMKTTESMIGGTLKQDAFPAFSKYFAKFVTEMRKEGVNIDYVSVQNEPDFIPTNYPGMKLSPSQRIDFVKNHLGPEFSKLKDAPKILEWDHNWDKPEQPLEVLSNPDAVKYYDGVAWHCYGGDVSAQSKVKDAFHEKNVYFTECSGGEWGKDWKEAFGWQVKNLIIGATKNHARGVLLWNLALDENFGPHVGGCGDCRGVITINSKSGEITRNMEYYALGHLTKFVKPGAKRIYSSDIGNNIDNVAFKNEDGSLIVIFVNTSALDKSFSLKYQNKYLNLRLGAGAAMTIITK